jgi:hypothetical protein
MRLSRLSRAENHRFQVCFFPGHTNNIKRNSKIIKFFEENYFYWAVAGATFFEPRKK